MFVYKLSGCGFEFRWLLFYCLNLTSWLLSVFRKIGLLLKELTIIKRLEVIFIGLLPFDIWGFRELVADIIKPQKLKQKRVIVLEKRIANIGRSNFFISR